VKFPRSGKVGGDLNGENDMECHAVLEGRPPCKFNASWR
jgi:hypothetical protein